MKEKQCKRKFHKVIIYHGYIRTFCVVQLKYSKLIIQMLTKGNLARVYHCYLVEKLPGLFELPLPEVSLDYFNSLYLSCFLASCLTFNSLFSTQKSKSSLWNNKSHITPPHKILKELSRLLKSKSQALSMAYKSCMKLLQLTSQTSSLTSLSWQLCCVSSIPSMPQRGYLLFTAAETLFLQTTRWLALSLSPSLYSNFVSIGNTSWSWSLYLK